MKILSTYLYRKVYLYISWKSILCELNSMVNEITFAIDLIIRDVIYTSTLLKLVWPRTIVQLENKIRKN